MEGSSGKGKLINIKSYVNVNTRDISRYLMLEICFIKRFT